MQDSNSTNVNDETKHDNSVAHTFNNSSSSNNNNNNVEIQYNSGGSKYIPGRVKSRTPTKPLNRKRDVGEEEAGEDSSSEISSANVSLNTAEKKPEEEKSFLFLLFYNISMIAILTIILFGIGVYIASFFYFALKEDSCAWYIKDTKVGSYMPIRHYLLVTGCILIVIFVATLYKSLILQGLTAHQQTIRSAKVPYWLAVIVFDVYLVLGSIVFWSHTKLAKEVCDKEMYAYLRDVFIVNYMVAAFLNYLISGLVHSTTTILHKIATAPPEEPEPFNPI